MTRIVSDYIWPLEKVGRTGHIHSMFSRSFNIQVDQQLIHVSSYPNYLSGFGLHIEVDELQEILSKIAIGNLVKIQSDQLVFYTVAGTYHLSLKNLAVQSLSLPKLSLSLDQIDALLFQMEDYTLTGKMGLAFTPQVQAECQMLVETKTLTAAEISRMLHFFIGRGSGLTPSGDDLLLAYLVTLMALSQQRGTMLKEALKKMPLNTTDVSRAYLNAACFGVVSSPIQQFFESLQTFVSLTEIKKAYERILQIGHTSGKDMGYGIYLALKYYQSKEKE